MSAHSIFGASAAVRWMNCLGSIRLSLQVSPLGPSPYAEEGNRAHAAAAHRIMSGNWPPDTPEDMRDFLQPYVDLVETYINSMGVGDFLWVEHRVTLSIVDARCFGTLDIAYYDARRRVLVIIDLKFGAGIRVEVVGNPQLKFYAAGALLEAGVPCDVIEMIIVQPRMPGDDGGIRRCQISPLEIFDFVVELKESIRRAEAPDAPLAAGPWCRYCPASAICPELRAQAQLVAESQYSPLTKYDPVELSELLGKLPVLEGWIRSVREFAYAEMERGAKVPGWKLVTKAPRRRWKDGVTEISLSERFGLDGFDVTTTKLKTPHQVERLIADQEVKIALREMTVFESSGTTLAREHDPRRAVTRDPADDFSPIGEEGSDRE